MSLSSVCPLESCTGCYACFNICPTKAINIEEDEFGNVYPVIDDKKCIKCNLCKKTCPSLSERIEYMYPKKCFAAYSQSNEINISSSSGGIAYELGKYFILNNGVYYGVSSFLKNNEIGFERISKIEDLHKTQGSKYVHAYVRDIYKHIKEDLDKNIMVLFIATPCQIAGLKCYLKKEYDNLYVVDIICHGVPSQKLLREEIGTDFDYISFRQGKKFNLIAKNKNKIVYEKNKYSSIYFYLFLKGITYRENCYNCKYARNERVGDITLGDFWGLDDNEIKSNYGTSIILTNTKKGEKLINSISEKCNIKEKSIIEGLKNNPQLNYPTYKTKQHNEFLKKYRKSSLKGTMKIYKLNDYMDIINGNIKDKIKKIIFKG